MAKAKAKRKKSRKAAKRSPSVAQISAKESAEWRARDDLRTLTTADEIAGDPKRLKAAQTEARKQAKAAAVTAGKLERKGKG
jgi:hypothetical protein